MTPQSTLLSLALALVACHGPTLWIGDLGPDAATPSRQPITPAEGTDVSDAAGTDDTTAPPPQNETDASLPPQTTSPPSTPTKEAPTPPSMRDAGVVAPLDDSDAGESFPWTSDDPKPTKLPAVRGHCPDLTRSGTYTFGDVRTRTLSVDVYIAPDAGTKQGLPGPLILYFHAIGSNSSEVQSGLGQTAIDAITMLGGVVASFSAKLCATCGVTEDVIWFAEDDAVIDQVVACSIEQANIDTRRIHAMGFSAGAMHSLHLAIARSDYIASVVSYSGGRTNPAADIPQDPTNHVAALLAYGRSELDFGGVDFPKLSVAWYEKYKALGWYSMLCDHQGGHVIPEELGPKALYFLLDHGYKLQPERYAAGVPKMFPSYCSNMPRR
jgi:hypothetical protein